MDIYVSLYGHKEPFNVDVASTVGSLEEEVRSTFDLREGFMFDFIFPGGRMEHRTTPFHETSATDGCTVDLQERRYPVKLSKKLEGHRDAVSGVVVTRCDSCVLSGSTLGDVLMHNFKTGEVVHRYNACYRRVNEVIASLCGKYVIACGERMDRRGGVTVFDLETELAVHSVEVPKFVFDLACSRDGTYVFSCSETFVKQHNITTGAEGHTFDSDEDTELYCLTVSKCGRYLFGGGQNEDNAKKGTVYKWDIATGKLVDKLRGGHAASYVNDLTVTRCGQYLLSGGGDGYVLMWDVESGRLVRTMECGHEEDCIWNLSTSRCGTLAQSSGADGICYYSLETGGLVHTLGMMSVAEDEFGPEYAGLAASRCGRYTLAGCDDSTIHVYELDF
eukprot:Rhum_TRINITY_DN3508_c0_g2::Rhum_TRINITY_DN3508_c0_g2_i1::g.11072::m.11072